MKIKFFLILLLVLGGLLIIKGPALATTIISPVMELTADPDTDQPGVVKVYNETLKPLLLQASVEQFSAGSEDGQPVYLPEDQQADYLKWFKLGQESIRLEPGQAAVIPFRVEIPATAVPGGYYATIFWEDVPAAAADGTVGVRGKVGTLIFLRVTGQVTETAELVEFGLKSPSPGTIFYRLPLTLVARLKNTGNVYLQPRGTVVLRNIFGKEKVFALGDGQANVLPASVRRFELVWGRTSFSANPVVAAWQEFTAELSGLAIGPYVAKLNLTYGWQQQHQLSEQFKFWVVPYHLVIVLVSLTLILSVIYRLLKNHKKSVKKNKSTPNDLA